MSELRIGIGPPGATWLYSRSAGGQPRVAPPGRRAGGGAATGATDNGGSVNRPRLDAVQRQRMETTRNIEVAAQNMTAALSRLRDADSAREAVTSVRDAAAPGCTWTIVG